MIDTATPCTEKFHNSQNLIFTIQGNSNELEESEKQILNIFISLQKQICKNTGYVTKAYPEQCTQIFIHTFKFSPTDFFTSKIVSDTLHAHAGQLENVSSCYVLLCNILL